MERLIEASAAVRADLESVAAIMHDPVAVMLRRGTQAGTYMTKLVADLHDGTVVRQDVIVQLGLLEENNAGLRCRLAWRPDGREHLLPAFEGAFEAQEDMTGGSVVRISGSYRPPFGPLGALADSVALQRVARRTLADFIQDLARAIDAAVDARRAEAWPAVAPLPDTLRSTPSEHWLG